MLWCLEPVLSFRFPGHLVPNRHGRRGGCRRVREGSARAMLVLLLMRMLLVRMLLMRMLLLMLLRSVRTRPSTRAGRNGVTALGKNWVTALHEARASKSQRKLQSK